jgi:hypothetical protein
LMTETSDDRILTILSEAKLLAQEYRMLTGKPLGITGEVAEYEAARILGVELTSARNPGYDAIELVDGVARRLQIKGRRLDDGMGGRLSKIDIEKPWDAVLLVMLDLNFDATVIYEAERGPVIDAITRPGSRARNERGQLAIANFRAIGRERWRRPLQPVAIPADASEFR